MPTTTSRHCSLSLGGAVEFLSPMFLLLAFTYFWATQAAPIGSAANNSTQQLMHRDNTCSCQDRSLLNIIWSCLATMFACSWVAIHPNVPAPGDSWFIVAMRRAKLMYWAILAPELIVMWAVRQWLSAHVVKKRFERYGWTLTHGFFLGMGGFMLYDGDRAVRTLTFPRFNDLEEKGLITFPSISEEEIRDKEKGGAFAKALVVLQTTWFVVQCVARVAQGLVLTELELFTLAIAVLNGAMYFLWWQKPLDVSYPVPVYLVHPLVDESIPNVKLIPQSSGSEDKEVEDTTDSMGEKSGPAIEEIARTSTTRIPPDISLPPPNSSPRLEGAGSNSTKDIDHHSFRVLGQVKTFLQNLKKDVDENGIPISLCTWVLYRPFIRPVSQLVGGRQELKLVSGNMRVATFYAPHTGDSDKPWTKLFLLCVSAPFGALHCLAWSFYFPSPIEKILWRSGSVMITAVPFFVVMQEFVTRYVLWNFLSNESGSALRRIIRICFLAVHSGITLFLVIAYVAARFLLLFQCLFLLRNLPPKAFQSVAWMDFIPHF